MQTTVQLSSNAIKTQFQYKSVYLPRILKAINNKDSAALNQLTHSLILDKNLTHKGYVFNEYQNLIQSAQKNGILNDIIISQLSPSHFFQDIGKIPPKELNLPLTNPKQPITSLLEVIGVGLVEKYVPSHKVNISKTAFCADKNHYQNNCEQSCGDYECEVTLDSGEKYYYRTDFKVTSLEQIDHNLDAEILSRGFTCNIYFVGDLDKHHVHTFKQVQKISLVVADRCNLNTKSNDPIAQKVTTQDMPRLQLYDAGKLNTNLYDLVCSPKIFGIDHYINLIDNMQNK